MLAAALLKKKNLNIYKMVNFGKGRYRVKSCEMDLVHSLLTQMGRVNNYPIDAHTAHKLESDTQTPKSMMKLC